MKYTDKALAGTAGLKTHIEDVNNFLGNPDNLRDIKDEMKNIFNQKLELGLIRNQNPIEHFSDNIPEYILAIANHNPVSSIEAALQRPMEEEIRLLGQDSKAAAEFLVACIPLDIDVLLESD